jgi:hypothetical protein
MDNAAPLEAEGMNPEQVAIRRREQFEMLQVTRGHTCTEHVGVLDTTLGSKVCFQRRQAGSVSGGEGDGPKSCPIGRCMNRAMG